MASLVADWQPGSDSSLAYMITSVMQQLGTQDSICAIDEAGIRTAALHQWLDEKVGSAQPVCLLGTSLAFVHWFERLQQDNVNFRLPEGSRLMDTGGFKGAQISIGAAELRAQYHARLGIPEHLVINEYGMTEMLSQFYDAQLADPTQMLVKQGPPWVRSAVMDPETLRPLPAGATGLLRHYDIANLFSVSAIQTEDLAVMTDAGFQLLGRAGGAAPRGCSIAMDVFLSSAGR